MSIIDNYVESYIHNYDFVKAINSVERELIGDNYKGFSAEFWKNPNVNLNKLKAKYNIPNVIMVSNILMQYSTDEYKNLIQDCWKSDSIVELVEKYDIRAQRLNQILFPIIFSDEKYRCPSCLDSHTFSIENDINSLEYDVYCCECKGLVKELITIEATEVKKRSEEERIEKFEAHVYEIRDNLKKIGCPKCQNGLKIVEDKAKLEYKINCCECAASYDDYEILLKDYEEWQLLNARILKIKDAEDELINSLLNRKKSKEVKVKVENIINKKESIDTLVHIVEKNYSDNEEAFVDLFQKIKVCTRLEKKLLVSICELINEVENNIAIWNAGDDDMPRIETRYINPEQPIVSLLLENTKIIIIRKTLRGLIANRLVFCCEEKNELHVHPTLIENIDKITSLLKPQNIENELAHLIFNKQRFTCYHCGENGRPLKIAYLSADKDSNNLNSMIGVCDLCFYNVTENEILIDGMITGVEELNNEGPISWQFLIDNYPYYQDDDNAYEINERYLDQYKEEDIIKAYAATIDKFLRDNKSGNFFAYAKAIIENSENGVVINKRVAKSLDVDRWLKDLN